MVIRPLVAHVATPTGGTVSVLAARPALDELDRRGVDPEPVLRRARLSRPLLDAGVARLPHRNVRDLWEAAAAAASDPWLALHVAETLAHGSYDLYDYLIATAETVGDGLATAARYASLVHGDSAWRLVGEDGEACLVRRVPVPSAQLDEPALASVVARSRRASGTAGSPTRVTFQHDRCRDDGELARWLGCPVAFGAPEAEMRIPATFLAAPHLRADARLFAILARHADTLLAEAPIGGELVASVSDAIARRWTGMAPTAYRRLRTGDQA